MASFNKLRGALEEDPFLHGVEPMSEDEASIIDHGDTSLARVAGLRQRPRLVADWQEKATEEEARKRMMAERLTPSPEMLSRVAERSRDPGLKLDSGIASPIPFASAPVKNDAPAPTTGAIAATTPTQPAPPADGSGGDDEMSSLRKQLGIQQMFEALGSAGSGKNLYTDGGILADRMKQVEALRAKKLQTAEERALEQQQYEGANLGTLTSNIASFKDRPEVVAALENLRSGAKYTKPSDFLKAVYQAVMNPPTVAKKEAEVPLTKAKTETEVGKPEIAKGGLVVKQGTLAERERSNKANEEIRRQALLVKQASDTKLSSEIRAAKGDERAAEASIRRDLETAESDKLGVAGNIRDFMGLEAVAPGFAKGQVPEWLGQGSIAAASKVPALNKKAAELASALELFTANIRKSLFGASLTGNEKASFDAIVSSGLTMPPEVLVANINRLRQGAARFAQSHFNVSSELHPEMTGRVLRSSALYGPALSEGGIYSDVWTLPKAPAAKGSVSAPTSGMTRMIGTDGNKYDVPNDKVEAAKAKGWKE